MYNKWCIVQKFFKLFNLKDDWKLSGKHYKIVKRNYRCHPYFLFAIKSIRVIDLLKKRNCKRVIHVSQFVTLALESFLINCSYHYVNILQNVAECLKAI